MEKTGAIILAAGSSSRLGHPKQFLTYEGKALLRRTVEAAAAAGCSPVIVVSGRDDSLIKDHLRGMEVLVVHNSQWQRGLGTSIRAGITHAQQFDPALDSILLLVCDQIHLTADLISLMRQTREEEQKPIVACRYAGSLGVPALFARVLFRQLQTLADASGAKELISQGENLVSGVSFPHGSIDIDTVEDEARYLGPADETG